jgi:hypothetical protein
MAIQQEVLVLAFDSLNSGGLPDPRDSQGGPYFGMTSMADANRVVVLTAQAVKESLAERDEAIRELRERLGKLES